MLHDDVAAHTARIRSVLRQALWKYNDYVAVRRALDQRHGHSVIFLAGDKVAASLRGAGRGSLVKQRACGEVQESFREQFEGTTLWPWVIQSNCDMRHRTNEEQEADRVVVHDIQRAAEVLRDTGAAINFVRGHPQPGLARW